MKERPILFKSEMVRAILDGRKTQTRRIVKPQPYCPRARIEPCSTVGTWFVLPAYMNDHDTPKGVRRQWTCPCGHGDRLWVRESCWIAPPNFGDEDLNNCRDYEGRARYVGYSASMDSDSVRCAKDYGVKQTPSIHMPRWASRITLEITAVRVERLQDISEEDAKAEGVPDEGYAVHYYCDEGSIEYPFPQHRCNWRFGYKMLWEAINSPDSWDSNPWVWVIEFRRVQP